MERHGDGNGSFNDTDHLKEDIMSNGCDSDVIESWELLLRDEDNLAIYPDALSNNELRMLVEMREAIKRAQQQLVHIV